MIARAPLRFPFAYRVYGNAGAEAFRIQLVAVIEADTDEDGAWVIASILAEDHPIDEGSTPAAEHQYDAILYYVEAEYGDAITDRWLQHTKGVLVHA